MQVYSGMIVDVVSGTVFPGEITVHHGKIRSVTRTHRAPDRYLVPGLGDAHKHHESTLMHPYQLGRWAAVHGTTFSISDPHEIANVLGVPGILWMLEVARRGRFKAFYGAPSCVPASAFESAGATIDADAVATLLDRSDIHYLSEVMDFPGVLKRRPDVMAKIEAAKCRGKPIDGHAPGLRGADAAKYAAAGITTDHECFTLEEALGKIREGMMILIREGSAAKNLDALLPLFELHPDCVALCTDDLHPDLLFDVGHMDALLRRCVSHGVDPIVALRAVTLNIQRHYRVPAGLLQPGDPADFVVLSDLKEFHVLETYIEGVCVARDGRPLLPAIEVTPVNHFKRGFVSTDELRVRASALNVRAIEVIPGQLVTSERILPALVADGAVLADPRRDILKLVVVNRYDTTTPPATAFVSGLGLEHGAFASTVAHDSHNIIAAGASDGEIAEAINAVVRSKGGLSVVRGNETVVMPLPIAGLMSLDEGPAVARAYKNVDAAARALGLKLPAPLMTLSFLGLTVIGDLKLSDRGLFDARTWDFTSALV